MKKWHCKSVSLSWVVFYYPSSSEILSDKRDIIVWEGPCKNGTCTVIHVYVTLKFFLNIRKNLFGHYNIQI